jgi:signal transduction histidine kinase
MAKPHLFTPESISLLSPGSWKNELESASSRYHITASWVAIIFDPIFAATDYINIPENWRQLLVIRLTVSVITLSTLMLRKRLNLPSYTIVAVPFLLISLQNAYTYFLIGNEDLLGHNLNYMALFIGGALFILWEWTYSLAVIVVSGLVSTFFIFLNPAIESNEFIVQGGVLLCASAAFMGLLIKTRYDLTVKEIKSRLALKLSNEEIQSQAEEIKVMNENLETLVRQRTAEIEKKNKALEEYAFINAHKLRSPVASILGLMNLMQKAEMNEEARNIAVHLQDSASKLDKIVGSITKAIERGDNFDSNLGS